MSLQFCGGILDQDGKSVCCSPKNLTLVEKNLALTSRQELGNFLRVDVFKALFGASSNFLEENIQICRLLIMQLDLLNITRALNG